MIKKLNEYNFEIKIIDFGLSTIMTTKELKVLAGTPGFIAPEVIEGTEKTLNNCFK